MKHNIKLTQLRRDYVLFKNRMRLIYRADFLEILFKEIDLLEKNITVDLGEVYMLDKSHEDKINMLIYHMDSFSDKFYWFDSIKDTFDDSIYMEGVPNHYHSVLLKEIFGDHHDLIWDMYDEVLIGKSNYTKEDIINIYLDMVNLSKKRS
jgi:hypothetical protein